jgi:flagellar protein FlaI
MAYLDDLMKEAESGAKKKKKEDAKPKKEEKKPLSRDGELPEIMEIDLPGQKVLIAQYGDVRIYRVEGEPLPFYTVPVIKPSGPEKIILNTIKEAATRLITVSPEEIRDPIRRREFYLKKVKEIILNSPELGVPSTKIDFYSDMVVREMIGYGVLDSLVKDEELEEIMVIGPQRPVYLWHIKYGMVKTNIMFGNDEEILNIASRIAREVNRRIDVQQPILDARLPDGSRVNATVPPISLNGVTMTIRKFRKDPFTIIDLVNFGTVNSELAAFMWIAADGLNAKPANILISGGTSSGKTTTLNAIVSFINPKERVLTIEDTAEVHLPIEHWVRFETRPPSIEGTGEVTLDILVKNSLRMRPDRIIVGEVRHAEAFTMFTAMNTGHDGCLGTVHANSAHETVIRLINPPMNVPIVMLDALDFVIVEQKILDRRKGMVRRITEVAEIESFTSGMPQMRVLFEWDAPTDTIKRNNVPSKYTQKLQKYTGMSKKDIDLELEKRKEFIEDLCTRGVRKFEDVVAEVKKFQGVSK